MRHLRFILRILGLIYPFLGLAAFATPRSQIENCPATTSTFVVSSGEKIELPLCTSETEYVSLMGYGDLEKTNAALAPLHLYAVPVNGKALFTFAALDYHRSTLGAYKEFIVGVMASPTPNLDGGFLRFLQFSDLFSPLKPPSTHGAVVLKIWVDNALAVEVGNEIWGFNKTLASIQLSKDHGFRIEDATGQLIMQTQWQSSAPAPVPFGQYLDFNTITASGVWAPAHYEGTSWLGLTGKSDLTTFGPGEWGPTLSSFDITPALKLTVPQLRVQLDAPASP